MFSFLCVEIKSTGGLMMGKKRHFQRFRKEATTQSLEPEKERVRTQDLDLQPERALSFSTRRIINCDRKWTTIFVAAESKKALRYPIEGTTNL